MRNLIGRNVVHAAHGAATVAGVEQRDIGDGMIELAVLEVVASDHDLTVMIPLDQLDTDELREPIGSDEAEEVLAVFDEPFPMPDFSEISWVSWHKENTTRSHSGNPFKVAEVLAYVGARDEPSPAELTLAAKCRAKFAAEIGAALGLGSDEVFELIDTKMRNCVPAVAEPA